MSALLVSFEANLVIKDKSPEELEELFDGLLPSNGLHMKNIKGRKLLVECMDSQFTEILEIDEDGQEVTFLNRKPELKYYPSTNNTFKTNDMIRINGKGDYNIILTPMFAFLYNGETQTTIEMDNVKNINDTKLYLEQNYPEYIVLRKIT
ncbi:hypothetical protein FJQ98_16120 [Lysinibacillus agricola]|uniref:Uncharacterized protein n=1 Tax=Lysinibacillus agricola TaxID=2590012 RepID=A0ABX7ANB4_9BACI|nr:MULTISPECIES: hypothetical protein [Lysinibacillus]KOS61531.1 hypothetical protein AN161_18250 [Lysinibacillus sp. FJAT-14222]QQP10772.1 hypothetical protein FJQ98_16120 [Lysinibacillus agricola]